MFLFPYLLFFTPNPPKPPTSRHLNWLQKWNPQHLGAEIPQRAPGLQPQTPNGAGDLAPTPLNLHQTSSGTDRVQVGQTVCPLMSDLLVIKNLFPDGFGAERLRRPAGSASSRRRSSWPRGFAACRASTPSGSRSRSSSSSSSTPLIPTLIRTAAPIAAGRRRLTESLLPIGVGARHAWLHSDCWTLWRERRRTEANAMLAGMGITP